VDEVCDGSSASCPSDVGVAANTVCRADNLGGCDVDEVCDGSSASCPSDVGVAANTVCRADNLGGCDVDEVCDGSSASCPSDVGVTTGTVCRTATGECDLDEQCDGSSASCPSDAFVSDGTGCTDDGDDCTDDECSSGSCAHPAAPVVCGDGNICPVETCDDGLPPADFDGCDATCQIEAGYACPNEPSDCELTPVVAGDIVITEIMKNPAEEFDWDGEWFEVYNPTGMDFELFGLEVSDLGTNSFTIDSSVIVSAGGYAVFSNNGDFGSNGGVIVDYEYPGSFALANGDDEIVITNLNGPTIIDEVDYTDAAFPDTEGYSLSLEPGVEDDSVLNDNGDYWCDGSSVINASDFGTPGAQNDSCNIERSCLDILNNNPTAPDDVYLIDPDGAGGLAPMYAECDMTTDNGGWTLVLNYVHQGGTSPPLDIRTTDLPTINSSTLGVDESATQHWGQAGNALFLAVTGGLATEVRYYGETSAHSNIMHFKASDQGCVNYYETGTGNCSGMIGGATTTPLAGHSTNLPTATANNGSNAGDLAMNNEPFYLAGAYHWNVGFAGFRWEVDDFPNNSANDTIHRVWVRQLGNSCGFGIVGSSCQINAGGAWALVQAYDIPILNDWDVQSQVPYYIDNSVALQGTGFTRIGYAMELDGDWAWTEFDTFTADTTLLGVPTDWAWDQTINNLTVLSNHPAVTPVVNSANGKIEFWNECYGTGLNGLYDYEDDPGGGDCYGSFQVHDVPNTIWAHNSWSNPGNGADDVGIGTYTAGPPDPHPDWTFAFNTGSYTLRRILVYIQ
jgi:cysteine-rich repeat protein